MASRLEEVFAMVKALPEDRQSEVIDLVEVLVAKPVELAANELAVLLPALEAVKRGEVASDEEMRAILDQPWG